MGRRGEKKENKEELVNFLSDKDMAQYKHCWIFGGRYKWRRSST